MFNIYFLFLLVFLITGLGNWGIPLVIYRKKHGLFKKRPEGFVGCNFWGIVMDVLIAGAINLVVWNYLINLSATITSMDIFKALVFGVGAMVMTHIFMAATKWKEWIMPAPWRWNAGGYWHMVSETLQMAYVFLVPVILAHSPGLLAFPLTRLTLLAIFLLGIFFLLALSVKNRDIAIGGLKISAKPW